MLSAVGGRGDHAWWQDGIVYQVYPRSFADSDGDGIGDLAGIRRRLDHLAWLGVAAVWISPIYPSPMVDGGYDVADYCGIDPVFGTFEDFDRLVADAHALRLRVILDLVPNHTSDKHPWFVESRRSRHDTRRDWYIWRDPAPDGGPPNNWIAEFGGPAWTLDAATGQYYYHAFSSAQPDLNWRNPDVRRAVYDAMRFWLDRGVDGFRVDVMWHLLKDEQLRDNPLNPDYVEGRDSPSRRLIQVYSTDQPEIHDVVAEMRAVLDEYDDRVMIGEIYLPIERLVAYYGGSRPGAHLPFNFHLILAPWDARRIERVIDRYEAALPDAGWPNWVLGNHDLPRVASRIGDAQARVAAVLLLTLRGTPTIYYGEELGLRDADIPAALVQDVRELNQPGKGLGRDPVRTPMPWDSSAAGGFSTGRPWLPIGEWNLAHSVAEQRGRASSTLTLYQRLIALRHAEPALAVGRYVPLPADGSVLAYRRHHGDRELVVALNLGHGKGELHLPADMPPLRVLLAAGRSAEGSVLRGRVHLPPDEALVLEPVKESAPDTVADAR